MIADLRSQKADLAVIDMSITSQRQTAVDFTMPFLSTGNMLISDIIKLFNAHYKFVNDFL